MAHDDTPDGIDADPVGDALYIALIAARKTARAFHNGNTCALEALMHVYSSGDDAAQLKAHEVLRAAGLLTAISTPDWAALEARKPKPMHWADAVQAFVPGAAERARLLALDDDLTADQLQERAEALVQLAAQSGLVLTIDQVSQQPLAMGHYSTRVAVRAAKGS